MLLNQDHIHLGNCKKNTYIYKGVIIIYPAAFERCRRYLREYARKIQEQDRSFLKALRLEAKADEDRHDKV